jgi:hypothetical protein
MSVRCLAAVLFLCTLPSAQAQLKVNLSISRRLYIVYEPIIATVTVTNLAGRDITLSDADQQSWFGFNIMDGDDQPVPELNVNHQLAPFTIRAGEVAKRSANLTTLYAIREFGLYRIRATIFAKDYGKYFVSPPVSLELTEGKLIWQQVVGVPEGEQGAGSTRTLSMLSHRQPKENKLYVRVEDKDNGIVCGTYELGRILVGNEPQIMLDQANRIHVLQVVGPKTYLYSRIGVNGEWLGQTTYNSTGTRPALRKLPSGIVEVFGGQQYVESLTPGAPRAPKLSDRPPGLPTQ